MLSAARGGDFKTGALAGAAAEGLTQLTTDALGRYLDDRFATDDQFKIGTAQIIGVLAGALGGSGDAATASWVAGNAERYNQQVHREAAARLEKGFATLHEQGQFVDLQPQDVLADLQKIADGEKDPSKLNPGTVEFLNQFSPADLREIFFEPTLTEQIVGLGIDLFFPTPTGKAKAAVTISEAVSKEVLEALEKKFGAALAEGTAKGAGDAASLANAAKLRGQLTGQEISGGHAFEKHVIQQGEYKDLGITTREQFASHIESVVNNPTSFRELSGGRTAYWDNVSGTVVIRNPKAVDGGTAFRPVNGQAYFDSLR